MFVTSSNRTAEFSHGFVLPAVSGKINVIRECQVVKFVIIDRPKEWELFQLRNPYVCEIQCKKTIERKRNRVMRNNAWATLLQSVLDAIKLHSHNPTYISANNCPIWGPVVIWRRIKIHTYTEYIFNVFYIFIILHEIEWENNSTTDCYAAHNYIYMMRRFV